MKKEVKKLLDQEVEKEILALKDMEPGTHEHAQGVEDAARLLTATEEAKKYEAEAHARRIEPWLGFLGSAVGTAGMLAGGIFSSQALSGVAHAAIEYEKTGIFATQTAKQLVTGTIQNLMKPKMR